MTGPAVQGGFKMPANIVSAGRNGVSFRDFRGGFKGLFQRWVYLLEEMGSFLLPLGARFSV